jgi:hypothetical protein
MMKRIFSMAVLVAWAASAHGQEVRTYNEKGTLIQETRQIIRRPVSETRLQERERTVYREQLTHDYQDTYRVYQAPVTEYRWETRLEGLLNPFVGPHLVQRLVPRTRWETHTEVVQAPVLRRELVPVTQIERVPVTTRRIVDEEVIRRVAIGDAGDADPFSRDSTGLASRPSIGGTSLANDPPRRPDSTAWRPTPNSVAR